MNGKFEEKLAMLAFGDLSPEEARMLEQKAASDAEASRALAQFRAMRSELKSLGDQIPPDQLSKERLRDAILGQGLRQAEPKKESRGWVWMPLMAGAAAFAFIFMRPTAKSEPMVVIENPPALNSSLAPRFEPKSEPVGVASLTNTQEAKPPKPVAPTLVASKSTPKAVRAKSSEPKTIVLDAKDFDSATNAKVPARTKKGDPAGTMTLASDRKENDALVASADSAGPIILIDTHKDEGTGASSATEVGTASNVLVGG